jgi:hypothetical protein
MREFRLVKVLGKKVRDAEGIYIGRLEEIEAERGDTGCRIIAYLVEHRGLLDRVSSWALSSPLRQKLSRRRSSQPYRVFWNQMDLTSPQGPRTLVPRDMLDRATGD